MNKERLRKLAQRLDKTKPEKFDMREPCGTACCIAGHAAIMARRTFNREDPFHFSDPWHDEIFPWASKYLDLTGKQAHELLWPDDIVNAPASEQPAPKQAAKVIRHLIKTGKVEWERFVP